MNNPTPSTQSVIELELAREFATTPESLFEYLTQAKHLENWFAPTAEMKTEVHEYNLSVGGKYRIAMVNPAVDEPHVVVGEFKQIDPPRRLVYTWSWESSEPGAETSQVTIELSATGNGTRLHLHHERFETEESRDKHNQGWEGCLHRLEAYCQSAQ